MAQTNFTPISLYYSTTAAAAPTAGNLVPGELAINITDGKLYYEDNAGVVQVIASKAGNVNVASISFGSTGLTPATATTGAVTVAGTLATTNGGTGLASFAANQIFFASSTSAIGQSANLTWNGTVLGTTGFTASSDSSFTSTGALTISKGDTSQRPTPVSGMLRFNTQTTEFEGYNGTAWASVGGAALVNDTSTASNLFPLFATATSGTAATLNTSNAKLLYKPSTGEFQSSAVVATNGLVINSATASANYTVAAGQNAMSVGPFTVNNGVVVTVSSGSRWVIL